MTRDDLKDYIRTHATSFLEPDRSGRGYICPICGSGSGPNGTGITTDDNGQHFTCWAGCYTHADIIDIIGQKLGIDPADFPAKLEAAAREMGIDPESSLDQQQRNQIQRAKTEARQRAAAPDEPDYTDFFLQAHKHINETDYHRGLTQATLDRFQIGYVAEWREQLEAYLKSGNGLTHSGKPKTPETWERIPYTPRLIIPTGKGSYLARDTRAEIPPEQAWLRPKKKVNGVRLLNLEALGTATKPIIVVEGEIDALSVIDVGGEAIGLGGTAMWETLARILKEQKPAQPLIIALDNDIAGQEAAQKLAEELQALNIPYSVIDICPGYKDANEALVADREAFKDMIKRAEEQAIMEATNRNTTDQAQAAAPENEPIQEAEEDPQLKFRQKSAAYGLAEFYKRIQSKEYNDPISTGFKGLDKLLDGGLYPGLYFIGAISSLGKTTFALQIADQIAQSGHDVLIFSLEMSKYELMAKSISRLTYTLTTDRSVDKCKTTRGILRGNTWRANEKPLIDLAFAKYQEYANYIYISEGTGNIGVAQIRKEVEEYIATMHKPPVVFIDYLQILAPEDPRSSDKQNTDRAVSELYRMRRDLSIPVIAISSFNRDNYTEPVNQASFKESGAIEYSSDVLIGLQFNGMDYIEGEKKEKRQQRIYDLIAANTKAAKDPLGHQEIQVKVLKARLAPRSDILMDLRPMFNCYEEQAPQETEGRTAADIIPF